MVKGKVNIITKAHLKDENGSFTLGETVDMYDDIEITSENYKKSDGLKYQTFLYAVNKDQSKQLVAKSTKKAIDVETDQFIAQELMKEVDTSQTPEVDYFSFSEEVTDMDENVVQRHNENMTLKEQSLYPKAKEKGATSPVYNIILPNTGEKIAGYLTALGFLLMSGLAYLKIKKDKKDSGKSED